MASSNLTEFTDALIIKSSSTLSCPSGVSLSVYVTLQNKSIPFPFPLLTSKFGTITFFVTLLFTGTTVPFRYIFRYFLKKTLHAKAY